ncbi:MAG: hypothetical protein ACR2NF_01285 [Pirellulales bacterium]
MVRIHFEQLFDQPFPKAHPNWLRRSKKGRALELDGYCESLGIAFEHNGQHHYKAARYNGSRVPTNYKRQRMNDSLRRRRCKANDVVLIEVPQVGVYVSHKDLKKFIIDACKEVGRPVPRKNSSKDIDLSEAYGSSELEERLNHLREAAKANGGELLSTVHVNVFEDLQWRCGDCGDVFEMSANNVLHQKSWCTSCSLKKRGLKRRHGIDKMHDLARSRGGRCLSETYTGVFDKLQWQCEHGHKWETTPQSVIQGKWCHVCAESSRRKTATKRIIAERQATASELNCEYLGGDEQHGHKSKSRWRCKACSYEFEDTPNQMRTRIRKGIYDFCLYCRTLQLADDLNHKLISDKYKGSFVKLRWQCLDTGEVVERTPATMRQKLKKLSRKANV